MTGADAEHLRRALIEAGFVEAAAMLLADIEAQSVEEEEHDDEVLAHVNFGDEDPA